jgi:hypothetical protein
MLLQLKAGLQRFQAVSVICKQTGKHRGSVKRITSLAETKRKPFTQFKSLKTPESHNMYKVIRNYVNAKIMQIKRDFWESHTKNMERDFYGQQKRIWRMIQNKKKETQ